MTDHRLPWSLRRRVAIAVVVGLVAGAALAAAAALSATPNPTGTATARSWAGGQHHVDPHRAGAAPGLTGLD